jgi:hypothetical protein
VGEDGFWYAEEKDARGHPAGGETVMLYISGKGITWLLRAD